MTFKEPTVEFVRIDTNVHTYTSSQECPEDEMYIGGTPSEEYCDGPQAPGNNCNTYNFTIMN